MGKPEDYTIGDEIGKGAFSRVYKLIRIADKQVFAVKVIDTFKSNETEADFLQTFNSPFIVKYEDSFRNANYSFLIMEYCKHGNLRDFLRDLKLRGARVQEQKAWQFLASATIGLDLLHSHGIIHRDLKPENFFLDENFNAKIGDLGVARQLHAEEQETKTQAGTPMYFSPEITIMNPYAQPTDIYSLGVILLEIVTLEACNPYHTFNRGLTTTESKPTYDDVLQDIISKFPPDYSDDIKQVITAMLAQKPDARPTASALLKWPKIKEQVDRLNALGMTTTPEDTDYRTIVPTLYDARETMGGEQSNFINDLTNAAGASPSDFFRGSLTTSDQSSMGRGTGFIDQLRLPSVKYTATDLPRIHAKLKDFVYPLPADPPPDETAVDTIKRQVFADLSALATALSQAKEQQIMQLISEGLYFTLRKFLAAPTDAAIEPVPGKDPENLTFVVFICRCCVFIWNHPSSTTTPFMAAPFHAGDVPTKEPFSPAAVLQFTEALILLLPTAIDQSANFILTATHRFLQQGLPMQIIKCGDEERSNTITFAQRMVRRLIPRLGSGSGEVVERAVKMLYLICIRVMAVSSREPHPLVNPFRSAGLTGKIATTWEQDELIEAGKLVEEDVTDKGDGPALMRSGIDKLHLVCETTPNEDVKLYAAICLIHIHQMQSIPEQLRFVVDIVIDKVKRPGEWVTNCLGALRTLAGYDLNHHFLLTDQFFNYVPRLLNNSQPQIIGHTLSVIYALVRFGSVEKARPFVNRVLPQDRLRELMGHQMLLIRHNATKLETELTKTD